MKFEMNNRTWEIKELSQEAIRKHIVDYKYDGQPQEGRYYGQTYFSEQTIYLDKDLHPEQKIQTLIHELVHCYIGSFITIQGNTSYTEEDVADIISNSHSIIHGIVDKYLLKNKLEQQVEKQQKAIEKSKKYIETFIPIDKDTILMREKQKDYLLETLKEGKNE